MRIPRRLAQRTALGLAILVSQVIHTGHRKDLPSHQNQDPSADVGSPDLPLLRILLVGDSSMTAPGVEPLDMCWPRRIARYLSARYCVELRSVAIGGCRASEILRDQMDAAFAMEPDMVLLSVGANDALRAVPVAAFERNLDEILRRFTSRFPAVGVGGIGDLGTLPRLPTIPRAWATVRARSFNNAISRSAARYGVAKSETWGPIWDPFSERGLAVFAGDQFHASAEGHAIFAESMEPVVDPLVARLEPGLSARRESRESST